MNTNPETTGQEPLTNGDLYRRQMAMLKSFLEHGAISPEQYRISADGLTQKMHLQPKE